MIKHDGWRLVIAALLVILIAIVVYPLLVLILYSLGISVQGWGASMMAYQKALADPKTLSAIRNTFYVAGAVSILATLLGGALAWMLTRTDLPGKRLFRGLIFLAFIIPSYIMAVSWIELLGRNGYINRLLCSTWQWIDQPVNIYNLEGIILVMSIHLFPLVFFTMSSAWQLNDLSLERAARLFGAGPFKTILTVSVPLILPGILSIGLLVFQHTMACFGVAAVMALPTGNYILTTRIYSALNHLDLPGAAASSIILLFCSSLVFAVYTLGLRKKRYINVNTRSEPPEPIKLGRWRAPAAAVVAAILSVTTLVPLGTIVVSSFLKQWGMELSPNSMTLHNYRIILANNGLGLRAIGNSIIFGALAASAACIIGVAVAWTSNRTSIKGRSWLEFAATWPVAIPGTVLAMAAILAWSNPFIKLYGTPWVLIITYIAACLPFAVRSISGSLQGIDLSLEDAARMSGASRWRAFSDISLPLLGPGMRNGWIMSFLMVLREIPISILLYTTGFETIGVLLFNIRSDTGGLETVSAIAVIIIVVTLTGHLFIEKTGKSRKEGM